MYFVDLANLPEGFKTLRFPGGEPHISIPQIDADRIVIDARIVYNWEQFGYLLVLLNALQKQSLEAKRSIVVELYIPYFPGARQDRNPKGLTPLTVELYASLLAAASSYDDNLIVKAFDIHSEKGLDLIRHHVEVEELDLSTLPGDFFDSDIDTIVSPDKGALNRAKLFRDTFYPHAALVPCEKIREFETGKITSYTVPALDPDAKKYLVIDDICDGGWTFNVFAESWAARAAEGAELHLYVSHGIFSNVKGVNNLSDHYTKIYTTDSRFISPDLPGRQRLIVIPMFERIFDEITTR